MKSIENILLLKQSEFYTSNETFKCIYFALFKNGSSMLREKAIVISIGYKNSESSKHKMKKQKPDNDKYRKSSYSTNLTTMYGNKISFELVH